MKARFHLPNFTNHFMFNLTFVEMLSHCPHYFREGVEIASIYGTFPPAVWNGGRLQTGRCDESFVKQVLSEFNKRGVPLRFTFTNPVLEEEHLKDEFCNRILQLADNGLNECIVASPLLEDYLRTNYPNFKLTSSTCKRITNPEKLVAETEKDYHIVVIDYDLNHNYDALEKIEDKSKCEILVNACCEPKCPYRSAHYRSIGKQQILYSAHVRNNPEVPFDFESTVAETGFKNGSFNCEYMEYSLFQVKDLANHITPDEIWNKYIPMGFEQFKIEGRTFDNLNLIEHYMYYMIKPEYRDEARFIFMKQLTRNKVVLN